MTLSVLLLSFQCHKPYKDNSTILIKGNFIDLQNQPLNNLECYVSLREIGTTNFVDRLSHEKIITTNSEGHFQALIPDIRTTRYQHPVLAFTDTTYKIEYVHLGDTLLLPYLPFNLGSSSADQQIDFGTIHVFQ